jgi:hypothetical protein
VATEPLPLEQLDRGEVGLQDQRVRQCGALLDQPGIDAVLRVGLGPRKEVRRVDGGGDQAGSLWAPRLKCLEDAVALAIASRTCIGLPLLHYPSDPGTLKGRANGSPVERSLAHYRAKLRACHEYEDPESNTDGVESSADGYVEAWRR